MSETAIEVDSLVKVYNEGLFKRNRVEALSSVSFAVEKGSIFGLLGPNGAGKTTMIKVLLGLVRKSGGHATLLGKPAGNRVSRKQVGYLPENHRIPHHLTGNSALFYYGGLSGLSRAEVKRQGPELMERVGLGKWGGFSVKKSSKGMLQRLGMAQAMLHKPELLILDEPTDGVDPVGRNELRALMNELRNQGSTIFINSHLLQEIELVCDRAAILVHGKLRRQGSIAEITARHAPHINMELAGNEVLIREALSWTTIESIEPLGSELHRISVTATDAEATNRCIDELRKREITIVSLTRPRDSLEDAFINIVNATSAPNQ